MDADVFATRLAACAPRIEEGLCPEEQRIAESFLEEFLCKKRRGMDTPRHDDPVIDLVLRYDVSKVQIGLVSFRSTVVGTFGKLWFGGAAADPLVLDPASLRVQLLDHAALPYVICECANTGGQFLDALIAGLELQPGADPFDDEFPEAPSLSLQCARIAGNEEFWPFYRDVLRWGPDEDT